MNLPPDCDERLNAFVDGEAGAAEREEVFAAIAADPALERRIADARRLKALVHHAYEDVAPPMRRRKPANAPRRAAALALFALGLATGWMLSAWHGGEPGTAPRPAVALARPSARMPGVVIQVADRDPEKWRLAIEQAKAVVDPEWRKEPFDVVIVAYGPGLGMLRSASPVRSAVNESLAQGIRFVACGNTMENDHVAARELLPGVTIARSGASLEILALERAGYAYVRI